MYIYTIPRHVRIISALFTLNIFNITAYDTFNLCTYEFTISISTPSPDTNMRNQVKLKSHVVKLGIISCDNS